MVSLFFRGHEYNALRTVKTGQSGLFFLDIANWAAGVYFAEIKTNGGVVRAEIVKN